MTAPPISRAKVVVLCGIVLAAAVRVPGMTHDFWLDEVWSYLLVQEVVTTHLDIVTRLHIDNNHPLNSWFLYALGQQRSWWMYRLPSLLFGIASVVVASRIMSRRGVAHQVAATILIGSSYPLIVYASEARGYSSMVFFVLAAIDAHERYGATRQWRTMVAFWAAVIFGFASHLTFFHAYAAFLAWSIYESRRPRAEDPPFDLAALHGVPLVLLAGFYVVYIRHLRVAGAEPASLMSVLGGTLAVVVGTPETGAGAWIAAGVVVAVTIEGLRLVRKADSGLFAFFVVAMFVAPALMVAIELETALFGPRFFPRYFLVSITLFLLLFAWVCGEYYQRGARRAAVATAIMSLCVFGNLWHVALFIRDGRGHYREALGYIARENADAEIRVSSNSDFRTGRLLAFYRQYLPPDKRLTFHPMSAKDRTDAEWRILEDVEPRAAMPEEITDDRGGRFRLIRRFPFYGLSGAQWTLYRRASDVTIPSVGR